MKFGSKGDISPWIYVIAAVIGIAIVLYLLWSKGMLPFVSGANEAECTAYFIRVCNENIQDPIKKTICASFGKTKFSAYEECFPVSPGTPVDCTNFCSQVLASQ